MSGSFLHLVLNLIYSESFLKDYLFPGEYCEVINLNPVTSLSGEVQDFLRQENSFVPTNRQNIYNNGKQFENLINFYINFALKSIRNLNK